MLVNFNSQSDIPLELFLPTTIFSLPVKKNVHKFSLLMNMQKTI